MLKLNSLRKSSDFILHLQSLLPLYQINLQVIAYFKCMHTLPSVRTGWLSVTWKVCFLLPQKVKTCQDSGQANCPPFCTPIWPMSCSCYVCSVNISITFRRVKSFLQNYATYPYIRKMVNTVGLPLST